MELILLPNQLFKKKYIPKNINKIYLIEEPIYFGYRDEYYNFNKLKLLLHRSSMKYYYDYISKYYKVEYIEFNDVNYKRYKNKNIIMFHYYDYELDKKLKELNITYLDTPNQVIKDKDFEEYNKKNKKRFRHNNFYNFVKNKLKILQDTKSQDIFNRKPLPKNHKIIKNPKLTSDDIKYIEEGKKYIKKYFPNNYGDVENFIYPVTHKSSEKWLNHFLKKKFEFYGDYQDSINNEDIFIYHSIISPMLNIGLLNPLEIVKKIEKEYKNNNNIKLNDYEGFIRQIIGWRTYQILIYKFKYNEIVKSNIFNNNNKISKKFYNGTTNIPIVDFFIKSGFKYGYLHHIVRLMIISNFMNLCQIRPKDIYKWFMEFSVDSYDWVMICNVYSMGLWSDSGLALAKPYISTSNYILKLSNFKKGEWTKIWDNLFYNFINNNKNILKKTIYKNNINYFNKLDKDKKYEIINNSNKFIELL